MKYIAIIPARGGSKRFPRKNISELNGIPLIVYSIMYAKNNPEISDIYVSTDDDEIKSVSKNNGAKILNRPSALATDFASTASVLQDAVYKLIADGIEFDYVVLLQPTNPLRPQQLMGEAIKLIEEKKFSSIMSVNKCSRKLGKIEDDKFKPWNYFFGQRSQDMDPLFYENGLLYITSKELLLEGKVMDETTHPLLVNHIYGEVDIDTFEDMKYAEFVIKNY